MEGRYESPLPLPGDRDAFGWQVTTVFCRWCRSFRHPCVGVCVGSFLPVIDRATAQKHMPSGSLTSCEAVKRQSKLGFVVSLHLAIFSAGVYPPNTVAGLVFGAGSALVAAGTLFYELTG